MRLITVAVVALLSAAFSGGTLAYVLTMDNHRSESAEAPPDPPSDEWTSPAPPDAPSDGQAVYVPLVRRVPVSEIPAPPDPVDPAEVKAGPFEGVDDGSGEITVAHGTATLISSDPRGNLVLSVDWGEREQTRPFRIGDLFEVKYLKPPVPTSWRPNPRPIRSNAAAVHHDHSAAQQYNGRRAEIKSVERWDD